MTSKLLSILTAILAVITALGAMDLSGIIALFPGDHTAMLTLISGILATLGTILRAIGDLLDDGQANGSYGRLRCHALVWLFALVIALACTSCAGLTLTASLPWGDVHTADGHTTITARPIVLPTK